MSEQKTPVPGQGAPEPKKKQGWWPKAKAWVYEYRVALCVGVFGVVVGLGGAAGFATAVDYTHSLNFCAHTCHEMEATVYQEYTHTIHYKNPQGVVVVCADCHVPRNDWWGTVVDKIVASKEIFAHTFLGASNIDTFTRMRPELEKHVLAGFAANNAAQCKSCHKWNNMILAEQKVPARIMHTMAMKKDENCLDCHKGIAHQLLMKQ